MQSKACNRLKQKTVQALLMSLLLFFAYNLSNASDSTALVGTAVGTGAGAATTTLGTQPYFFGVIQAMEISCPGGGCPSKTNAFAVLLPSNQSAGASDLNPWAPTPSFNYNTMAIDTNGSTCMAVGGANGGNNGTPGNCVIIPYTGVYRIMLNYTYVNNNGALSAFGFWGRVYAGSNYIVTHEGYMTQTTGGITHLPTTNIMQGVGFSQVQTNTVYLTAGTELSVFFDVSTWSPPLDLVISGGSLEVMWVGSQ